MRKENQSHVNNVILVACRRFMKEKSHLMAKFAKLFFFQSGLKFHLHVNNVILVTCRRFMKVRSNSNAVFVILCEALLLVDGIWQ